MKSLMTAKRSVAAGVAGVLVAGAASVLAAPAHASGASGALTWNVSTTYTNFGFSELDGATYDADTKQFTFPAESTSTATDGTVTSSFGGTVEKGFTNPVTQAFMYSITIANPTLVVEADGDGRIQATVHSTGSNADPALETTPTEVTVAEFSGATTTGSTTTGTPNFEGVLPAGSAAATALGIPSGQPLDGKAFNPEFLAALHKDVRAHFYVSSTSASQANKTPGAFSATVDAAATVTPKVTKAHRSHGVDVTVSATDFPAGTTGTYVILAPSDTVIDPSDQAGGMAQAAAVAWVDAPQIVDEKFTVALSAPAAKITAGKPYSIFTIAAHGVVNPDQVTVTPVAIDWAKYNAKTASKTKVKVAKKATRKKAGKAKISVTGATKATGKVKVTLKVAGVKKAKKVKATLKNGKAVVKLPKAKKKGTYKVTVTYVGDANLKSSRKTVKFKVKK